MFSAIILYLDPSVLSNSLLGHTDAVWGLSLHSQKLQMLSCSADGTVRLWNPQSKSPLLSVFTSEKGKRSSSIYELLHKCIHKHSTKNKIMFFFIKFDESRRNSDVSGFCS